MTFADAPPGTALIRFEDGSAIVKSDGSEAELDEMVRFFANMKARTISPDALEIIQKLLADGLAIKAYVPPDAAAFSAKDFESMTADIARFLKGED